MSDDTRLVISETEFNSAMREALSSQGYRALHIREAHITGVADLIVYQTSKGVQVIRAWLELKVKTSKSSGEPRPAQIEFMRDYWRLGRNSFFVTLNLQDPQPAIEIKQGHDWCIIDQSLIFLTSDPKQVIWADVFKAWYS